MIPFFFLEILLKFLFNTCSWFCDILPSSLPFLLFFLSVETLTSINSSVPYTDFLTMFEKNVLSSVSAQEYFESIILSVCLGQCCIKPSSINNVAILYPFDKYNEITGLKCMFHVDNCIVFSSPRDLIN